MLLIEKSRMNLSCKNVTFYIMCLLWDGGISNEMVGGKFNVIRIYTKLGILYMTS